MKRVLIVSLSLLGLFSTVRLSAQACDTGAQMSCDFDRDGCPSGDWRQKCSGCTFETGGTLKCTQCNDNGKEVSIKRLKSSNTVSARDFKD